MKRLTTLLLAYCLFLLISASSAYSAPVTEYLWTTPTNSESLYVAFDSGARTIVAVRSSLDHNSSNCQPSIYAGDYNQPVAVDAAGRYSFAGFQYSDERPGSPYIAMSGTLGGPATIRVTRDVATGPGTTCNYDTGTRVLPLSCISNCTFSPPTPPDSPEYNTLFVSGTGWGNVTSTPGRLGGIKCKLLCSDSFAKDSIVTLTPTPGPLDEFVGWSGACPNTSVTCRIKMDTTKYAHARFRLQRKGYEVFKIWQKGPWPTYGPAGNTKFRPIARRIQSRSLSSCKPPKKWNVKGSHTEWGPQDKRQSRWVNSPRPGTRHWEVSTCVIVMGRDATTRMADAASRVWKDVMNPASPGACDFLAASPWVLACLAATTAVSGGHDRYLGAELRKARDAGKCIAFSVVRRKIKFYHSAIIGQGNRKIKVHYRHGRNGAFYKQLKYSQVRPYCRD